MDIQKGANIMVTHYQATLPNGEFVRRSSKTRKYSHAVVYKNKTNGKPNELHACWSSRRDLAEKNFVSYSKCKHLSDVQIVEATEITTHEANEVRKTKITDADKLATKVAAKLRKAGVSAWKHGKSVRVNVPQIWIGNDNPLRSAPGWYSDYFSEGSKVCRRNNRIARLIVRRAVERAGYKLDKNCWNVIL